MTAAAVTRPHEPSPTIVLRGNTSSGERVIFARAAKITVDPGTGRSVLSTDLLAIASKQARREEPVEIILVTADAHHSLLLPLPDGLILAAVVAEWETDPRFALPRDLTVVAGVTGARDEVEEGEWLIVDPVRQRVTVAPDAGAVARLFHRQRARYRLDERGQSAHTLTGLEVLVWARVSSMADVAEAVEAGADGFVVDGPGELLPWDTEQEPDGAAYNRLLPVADAAGGGDVALLTAVDAVDMISLVRLAAECRLRLILPPESLPLSLPELRAELSVVTDTVMDMGRLAAAPRLSALLATPPLPTSDPDEFHGFEEAALMPFADEELMDMTFPAVLTLPPLFVFLSGSTCEESLDALAAVVSAGVRGVVVPSSLVLGIKEAIANQE